MYTTHTLQKQTSCLKNHTKTTLKRVVENDALSMCLGLKLIDFTQHAVRTLYTKKIWVTSTIFWPSQLHACCVRNTLQNFKTSLPVVEKLLSQIGSSHESL